MLDQHLVLLDIPAVVVLNELICIENRLLLPSFLGRRLLLLVIEICPDMALVLSVDLDVLGFGVLAHDSNF